MENISKQHEKWMFETFGEKRYAGAVQDVCARLEEFNDTEAIALLEVAKASINLRNVFFRSDKPIKNYRSEDISGEVSDGGAHQA